MICIILNVNANQTYCFYFLVISTIELIFLPYMFVCSCLVRYNINKTSSKFIFLLEKERKYKKLQETINLPIVIVDLIADY